MKTVAQSAQLALELAIANLPSVVRATDAILVLSGCPAVVAEMRHSDIIDAIEAVEAALNQGGDDTRFVLVQAIKTDDGVVVVPIASSTNLSNLPTERLSAAFGGITDTLGVQFAVLHIC